jgi:hypothetical protein
MLTVFEPKTLTINTFTFLDKNIREVFELLSADPPRPDGTRLCRMVGGKMVLSNALVPYQAEIHGTDVTFVGGSKKVPKVKKPKSPKPAVEVKALTAAEEAEIKRRAQYLKDYKMRKCSEVLDLIKSLIKTLPGPFHGRSPISWHDDVTVPEKGFYPSTRHEVDDALLRYGVSEEELEAIGLKPHNDLKAGTRKKKNGEPRGAGWRSKATVTFPRSLVTDGMKEKCAEAGLMINFREVQNHATCDSYEFYFFYCEIIKAYQAAGLLK